MNRLAMALTQIKKFRYMLVIEGIISGAFSAAVVVLFRILLEKADVIRTFVLERGKSDIRFLFIWTAVLIVSSIAVYFLLKKEPYISGSGIPQVEGEIAGRLEQKWYRVLVAKFVGGVLSVGCGLSLGREGPSIQLGAMSAKGVAKIGKKSKTEERLIMTCDAGAGLAAAFNAPLAGMLFCIEEMHKNFSTELLLSVMASCVTADFISKGVFGLSPVFAFDAANMIPESGYGHIIILGIILGIFGAFYIKSIDISQNIYKKIPQFLRIIIPFAAAGIFGCVMPSVLGGGHGLLAEVSKGLYAIKILALILVVKFIFSMISFGSGAPGGIFLPLLVLGGCTGAIYYHAAAFAFPIDESLFINFIILGMAGYFSAIVRAPITGIILISEMTGSFSHLLTLSLVSLISYAVADLLKAKPVYEMLLDKMTKQTVEHGEEKIIINRIVSHGCEIQDKQISDIHFPQGCLVISVKRGNEDIMPSGDTMLEAGDMISLLCNEDKIAEITSFMDEKCLFVKNLNS